MDEEKKVVDIYPLSKWKRLLSYLADFFLTFMISLVLFTVATFPIAKVVTGFNQKSNESADAILAMHKILYDEKIVFQSPEYTKDYIEVNINYTYNVWLSYQCLDEQESPVTSFPQYGHKDENDNIYNFYHLTRSADTEYINLFNIYNGTNNYFISQGDRFVLKDDIKNVVRYYFDPRDELGEQGQIYYDNLKNNVFAPMLSEVFANIETNDLVSGGVSYKERLNTHNAYNNYYDTLIVVSCFITLVISWAIYYILVPFINRGRKTLAMIFMSTERVNIDRLYVCKKGEMIFASIYSLFTNMMFILFLPIIYVNFNYLFSLTILLTFSLASLLFNLVSLGFILFNSFNRSLSDIFSRSVMISTANLDEIYKAKGYNI